jgi:hypothetical protein
MDKLKVQKIVSEEVDKMFSDAQKNYQKIEEELEKLRKKLFKENEMKTENLGDSPVLNKRIPIDLVSEIIDFPVNELMLYALNCVKTKNERSLVEMHLGQFYFYNV